jgi:hypothetical protein
MISHLAAGIRCDFAWENGYQQFIGGISGGFPWSFM